MKIVLVSCVDTADDSRFDRFAAALSEAGHNIVAVACPPDSAGWSRQNVKYIYLPPVSFHFWKNSSWLKVSLAVFVRMKNCLIAFWRLLLERPDVCHCQEPDSWLISVVAKLFTSSLVVVDIREIYEERAHAFPYRMRSIIYTFIRFFMGMLSRRTDHIIHVSEARKDYYSYLKAPSTVISLFPNSPDSSYDHNHPRILELKDKFVLVHAGALRPNYAAHELLEAVDIVSSQISQVLLLVLGGITASDSYMGLVQKLEKKAKLLIVPYISPDLVFSYLQMSDVGISTLLPIDKIHELAFPRKLFEYMAAGLPIIGAKVPGIEKILINDECGIVVDASSPGAIADAIITFAHNDTLRFSMAKKSKEASRKYSWSTESQKLVDLYNGLEKMGKDILPFGSG
jgi:glycosyltransferase involved in cell wall biosynthesis